MSSGNRKCHYDTLGITKNATNEEVKAAFRKLSLQTHPDVAGAGACTERFKQISLAASILANAKNREAYDRNLASYSSNPFASTSFHRNSQSHNRQRPQHGMAAILVNAVRPRNLILGPIALFATVSLIQFALGIEKNQQLEGTNLVQAWKNPETGNYETPAPWDPVYRKLQPALVDVPRDQVRPRNR
jgi:curved DNA-binding protein